MATTSKVNAVSDQKQPSMEEQMVTVVKRVGKVARMVRKSPLYWESIELLAKDEISRGIFYALPPDCKLHYLKRKTNRVWNKEEEEPKDFPEYRTYYD